MRHAGQLKILSAKRKKRNVPHRKLNVRVQKPFSRKKKCAHVYWRN